MGLLAAAAASLKECKEPLEAQANSAAGSSKANLKGLSRTARKQAATAQRLQQEQTLAAQKKEEEAEAAAAWLQREEEQAVLQREQKEAASHKKQQTAKSKHSKKGHAKQGEASISIPASSSPKTNDANETALDKASPIDTDADAACPREQFGDFESGQLVFCCRGLWIDGVEAVQFGSAGLIRSFKHGKESKDTQVEVKFDFAEHCKPFRVLMSPCDISATVPAIPAPFKYLQIVFATEKMRFGGATVHFGAPCMVIGSIEGGHRIACVSSKHFVPSADPHDEGSFQLRNPEYANVLKYQIAAEKLQIPEPFSYEQHVFATRFILLGASKGDMVAFGSRGTIIGYDGDSNQVIVCFEHPHQQITIPVADDEIQTNLPTFPEVSGLQLTPGSHVFTTRDLGDPTSSQFVPFGSGGFVTGVEAAQLWVHFDTNVLALVWPDEISDAFPEVPPIQEHEVEYDEQVFALRKLANDTRHVPYGKAGAIAGYTETRKTCGCCSDFQFVIRFGEDYILASGTELSVSKPEMPEGFKYQQEVFAMHTQVTHFGGDLDLSSPLVQFGCQGFVVGIKLRDGATTSSLIVRFRPDSGTCIASVRPDQISAIRPTMIEGFKLNQKVWSGRACGWSAGEASGSIGYGEPARVVGVRADGGVARVVVRFYNEHGKRFNVGDRVLCDVGHSRSGDSGTITNLDYWEDGFPEYIKSVPYQIKLDSGRHIFAPEDNDGFIRLKTPDHRSTAIAIESDCLTTHKPKVPRPFRVGGHAYLSRNLGPELPFGASCKIHGVQQQRQNGDAMGIVVTVEEEAYFAVGDVELTARPPTIPEPFILGQSVYAYCDIKEDSTTDEQGKNQKKHSKKVTPCAASLSSVSFGTRGFVVGSASMCCGCEKTCPYESHSVRTLLLVLILN